MCMCEFRFLALPGCSGCHLNEQRNSHFWGFVTESNVDRFGSLSPEGICQESMSSSVFIANFPSRFSPAGFFGSIICNINVEYKHRPFLHGRHWFSKSGTGSSSSSAFCQSVGEGILACDQGLVLHAENLRCFDVYLATGANQKWLNCCTNKSETGPPADWSLVTGKKGDSAKQAGGRGWISDAWTTSNFESHAMKPKCILYADFQLPQSKNIHFSALSRGSATVVKQWNSPFWGLQNPLKFWFVR